MAHDLSGTTIPRGARKVFEGVVVSDKMTKTRIVEVERLSRHPFYEKVVRKTTRLSAHDETNASKAGDRVSLMSTRPLSKTKRWRIIRVVKKADEVLSGGVSQA